MEKFDYHRVNALGAAVPLGPTIPAGTTLGDAVLELRGTDYGYRIGAAYEIPEIAFRTELMYRSGTSYGADGTLTLDPGVAPASEFDAIGLGELPQSVELSVQSGVAPGWLAFGSVKWTDWSVTEQLISETVARNPITGDALISDTNDYFWRDGWTVTAGVGHAFTESVSGLAALTYDRGVGTGYDHSSDTWTLSLGGSFKDSIGGELRGGVGFTYLTSAEETENAINTTADAGWAVAGNIGYAVKW